MNLSWYKLNFRLNKVFLLFVSTARRQLHFFDNSRPWLSLPLPAKPRRDCKDSSFCEVPTKSSKNILCGNCLPTVFHVLYSLFENDGECEVYRLHVSQLLILGKIDEGKRRYHLWNNKRLLRQNCELKKISTCLLETLTGRRKKSPSYSVF